jgi:hypothetical protein
LHPQAGQNQILGIGFDRGQMIMVLQTLHLLVNLSEVELSFIRKIIPLRLKNKEELLEELRSSYYQIPRTNLLDTR